MMKMVNLWVKKVIKTNIYDFLIKRNYVFSNTGNYTLLVTHGMRDSILPGVVELGFKFEKLKIMKDNFFDI